MKCSVSYWFYQVTILTRLFWLTILPCLMDFSHFSLHCKLPFLILGIEVLNKWTARSENTVGCLIPAPSCFIFPLESTFARSCCQGKWIFCVFCNRGRSSSWIRRKNFYSHYFMIFPHKGGLERPPYLHSPVEIQKDFQHFVTFSDDSQNLTTPTDQLGFFCIAALQTVSTLSNNIT